MNIIEAIDVIEEDRYSQDAEGEMLAELGSSAFYGGAQGNGGYDAMQIAREMYFTPEQQARQAEFDALVREAEATVAYYESIAPEDA